MTDINREVGAAVLWIGGEAKGWGPNQIAQAARTAKTFGFDSICVKRAEGTEKWYGTPADLAVERQASLSEGVGFIPMHYSDGPHFGAHFDEAEAAVILEMLSVCPDVQIDMEAEWDGAAAVAKEFAAALAGHPGNLLITSWANPAAHGWDGVSQALRLVTAAWVPQEYNDYLSAVADPQLSAAGQSPIQVGIDLTQEFGANHQLHIMEQARAHGHSSFWFWEYAPAVANPALTKQLTDDAHGSAPAPAPPPAPVPANPGHAYTVAPGDSLWAIIHHLGLSISAAQLYAANEQTIEDTAHRYGHASSNNGNLLFVGTVLHY